MRLNYIPRRNIFEPINYGYLYNWYAAAQPQSIEYGYLYNMYAVNPNLSGNLINNTGWKVPTNTDITTLLNYLGGASVAGGKLKETGLTYWLSPNTGATNETGFNGRGSGVRDGSGAFSSINSLSRHYYLHPSFPTDVFVLNLSNAATSASVGNGTGASGFSVRLLKDTTTLSHGETGTYVGNDGRVYKTICIGTQEWLSENIMETKYQNGDAIPEVTDNTTWAGLTTGARCSYNNLESNAVVDTEIANVGWSVPTETSFSTLTTYLGSLARPYQVEGSVYWGQGLGTNTSGLSLVGSSLRSGFTGEFSPLGSLAFLLSQNSYSATQCGQLAIDDNTNDVSFFNFSSKRSGASIRLLKDSTTLSDGQTGTYTGNDGKIYPTICVGTQEWVSANLKETMYRDGSLIPVVTDNTEWVALTTGARCVYENNEANA